MQANLPRPSYCGRTTSQPTLIRLQLVTLRSDRTVLNNDTFLDVVESGEIFSQEFVPVLGINLRRMRSLSGGKEITVRKERGDGGVLDIIDYAERGLPGVRPEHIELALGRVWHDDEHFGRTGVGAGPCEAHHARHELDGARVRNWIVLDDIIAGLGAEVIVGRDTELREKVRYNAGPSEGQGGEDVRNVKVGLHGQCGYNAHTKQHVSFCALNKKEKETNDWYNRGTYTPQPS